MHAQRSEQGFEWISFPVGPLQCNCSILWDPETQDAIVVDPGADFPKISSALKERGLKLVGAVHTHAHFDHIGASTEVHQKLKAPLYLHPEDALLWENVDMQGQAFGFRLEKIPRWQKDLDDALTIDFGRFKLSTVFTPGHTPGSCSFHIGEFLFAGDTLFRGSIGRTDLWGGDFDLISKSLKQRIYNLDPDTTVICGHGPTTKVGIERKQNPFVKA